TLTGDLETCRRRADIAHEALIHGWPQLERWIEEWRKAEEIRRKLDQKAQEWIDAGTDTEGLLGTGGLAVAEMWLARPDGAGQPRRSGAARRRTDSPLGPGEPGAHRSSRDRA